ncbi:MAG TPA: hypothetical protein VGF29_12250 [Hyphomicrobiaceae bacterium]|jgi:hypothetical protein
MKKISCLARAYGSRPLERHALGQNGHLVYVANPSLSIPDDQLALRAVGFPREAIFSHDNKLFESLSQAFARGDADLLESLWMRAKPLAVDLPNMDDVVRDAVQTQEVAPG